MGVNDDLCHNAEQKIRKKRLLLQMWNTTKETAEKGQNSNNHQERSISLATWIVILLIIIGYPNPIKSVSDL